MVRRRDSLDERLCQRIGWLSPAPSAIAPMSHVLSVAVSLSPTVRQDISIQVLSRSLPISQLADQHQVSRKFVCQQGDRAQQALDETSAPAQADDEILFYLPVTKSWLYQLILGLVPLFEHSACIAKYQTAVEAAYKASFDVVPFIAAFCRAAQGFEDGVPIHYPRNPEANGKPDPKGENFKWFTDNEQGDRLSLPSLTSGKALPLKPRTTKKSPQGNGPASAALQRAEPGPKPSPKKDKPPKPARRT